MVKDLIIPVKDNEDETRSIIGLYNVRIVNEYHDLPEEAGAIWVVEGAEEDLEMLADHWNDSLGLI